VTTSGLGRAFGVVAAAAVLVLGVTACGGDGGSDANPGRAASTTSTTAEPLAAHRSWIATARVPTVAVYQSPDATEPSLQLENPWVVDPDQSSATVAQVFLVIDGRDSPGARPSGDWIEVLLPVRPNGSTGWVRAADVSLASTTYRIRVELGAHRITVSDAGRVVYQGPVAAGARDTPTPTGAYYLRVLIQAPDPNTAYGPFAYGLSSHSDALATFNGSDAEIGIHGNDDASALGHDVTHGCVRMDNGAITDLARLLPLGAPVEIVG
jgi:lipoprotein-anchoring transpeptidase ErfK/SrfK